MLDPLIEKLKSTTFFGHRLRRRQIAPIQEVVPTLAKLRRTELGTSSSLPSAGGPRKASLACNGPCASWRLWNHSASCAWPPSGAQSDPASSPSCPPLRSPSAPCSPSALFPTRQAGAHAGLSAIRFRGSAAGLPRSVDRLAKSQVPQTIALGCPQSALAAVALGPGPDSGPSRAGAGGPPVTTRWAAGA